MPDSVKARIETLGGFAGALAAVCPMFAGAGYIRRRSTSAGAVNSETGVEYQSVGEHIYLPVEDGSDAHRFLYALHDRAWLAGLGWHLVGKAGQLLERSIVDRMVCAPERLVFEAAPTLEPPLTQGPRPAIVHEGAPLDTRTACPDLTPHEAIELQRLKDMAANALAAPAAAAAAAFDAEQISNTIARDIDPNRARATVEAWRKRLLRPGAALDFDDKEIGRKTVADVLADLARFDGETLADPIEGVAYGRNCAIVQVCPNGEAQVYSFAHGGARYRLVHDVESIAAAIEAAPSDDCAKVLAKLIVRSDIGRDETDRLCKLAGARAGCGSRIAAKMVAEARAEQREAAARERRRLNTLEATRARLPAPLPDAEAKPIMEQWDDILANAAAPPMRDVEGWPVMVELREIAGLHELTSGGSNDDEDEKTRLPSPKNYLLTKHNRCSLEIELSDHITFYEETKDGDRAVGAPFRLLTHWLEYKRSTLPIVRAVVTMPLVLASGELMIGKGLDRERGVFFRIDPSLANYIPERAACTPIAVAKAYRYLTDEWLVDIAADREGKAVLIALALSIIERVLFPERPAFNVTAGLRGNGKTTVISMVLLAALGVKPPAMAWTHDGEERRKALYAVLREGAPLLVFDNIPRGTIIACSHIERALTTDVYRDRVLGESESPTAPAFTIIVFTGNNIGVKSDMASRILIARLTANRTDPENRPFAHDDPVAWTLDHRGDILNALYTVLLGNPRFDDLDRCAPKTRFKTWWHLVGSAVENAVQEATKTALSFEKTLKDAEAGDEEATARGAILKTLHSIDWQTWDGDGDRCFTTADLAEHLGKIADKVKIGVNEPPDMAELRRFCTSRKATAPTPNAITRALNAIAEAPTAVEKNVLTLHAWRDSASHAAVFKIVTPKEA